MGIGFILIYYVVEVEYLIEGWLEKNKDFLNDNIIWFLVVFIDKYIVLFFVDCVEDVEDLFGGRSCVKKGFFWIVV